MKQFEKGLTEIYRMAYSECEINVCGMCRNFSKYLVPSIHPASTCAWRLTVFCYNDCLFPLTMSNPSTPSQTTGAAASVTPGGQTLGTENPVRLVHSMSEILDFSRVFSMNKIRIVRHWSRVLCSFSPSIGVCASGETWSSSLLRMSRLWKCIIQIVWKIHVFLCLIQFVLYSTTVQYRVVY